MKTTTTEATIAITCPDWCDTNPQRHADDLWELDGCVAHQFPGYSVEDSQGYTRAPLAEPMTFEPVQVVGGIVTTPDGRPQETPVIRLNDNAELTPQQALAVAAALAMTVADLTQPVAGNAPVYAAAHEPLHDLAEQLQRIGATFVDDEEAHRARL